MLVGAPSIALAAILVIALAFGTFVFLVFVP